MTIEDPGRSLAQDAVTDELRQDLERQLRENRALPAVIAVDDKGHRLVKALVPVDTQGTPISDAALTEALGRFLEAQGHRPAAIGFVRVDVAPPEIVSIDCQSGRVVRLQPQLGSEGSVTWDATQAAKLDATPRGGSGGGQQDGEDGATLAQLGAGEQMIERAAQDALHHIGQDALKNLEDEIRDPRITSSDDVADDLMIDKGPVWGHLPVPEPAKPSMTLIDRLRQLRDHARGLETTTTATRFAHDGAIYLLGLDFRDGHEGAFLIRIRVTSSGRISDPESLDLHSLLGLRGS